ncbi:hypothetical protein E2562_030563 [Oryza meyeriana var. granulata]|uniref:Uncharacterized protein n=1 Tax=Oryza meyeriana var. granulata TaxID=110450 RepID=A0A6G1D8E0_9ORYZ|nr:hypothetical protein E2562_030563 [Oryza meyeriana var. granulata]
MALAEAAAHAGEMTIRVLSRRLVKASDASIQPHVAAVSNLDLYPNTYQASIVCLYPKLPKAGDFDAIVATFEAVLPSLLNHFYPLAGRIVVDPASSLPELHCHNQGVDLVVGEVDVALGSLNYAVTNESVKRIMLPYPKDVALSVQLLRFACGSFSVVWGNNNLLHDGHVSTMIVRMWSELARTGRIAGGIPINHDRSVFRPRSPPSYSAAVDAMFTTYDESRLVNVLTAHDSFVERLYYIEAGDIARLRDMASTELQRSSRVQAVSAYLWKVLAGVVAASRVPEERCCMGWYVDARRRVTSPALLPAMRSYCGNVTVYALGDAAVVEVREKPLAEVAAMVRESITSIDYDGYLQELVDWVEEHKTEKVMEKGGLGLGSPTVNQTVFASFPLDTDFGFGQASLAMPIWDHGRVSSGTLAVGLRPGGDGSWLVSAYIWPRLAAAMESDEDRIFKPLTAAYLGLI